MQCFVMYATGMYSLLSKISSGLRIFNFEYLSSEHPTYVSKNVRIHGYCLKPRGVCKEKRLGNTELQNDSYKDYEILNHSIVCILLCTLNIFILDRVCWCW